MSGGINRALAAALLCSVVSAAVFWRGLDSPFAFDDSKDIVERTELRRGVVEGVKSSPYRAVTYATYAVDWARGEGDAAPFHQTNLILHSIFVGVLAMFIFGFMKRYGFERPMVGTVVGALFFGLNPLMVSNVTYISGRAGILAGLFSLIALWLYLVRPFRLWAIPAIISFMLALFSKEDAAALPIIFLAVEFTKNKVYRRFSVPAIFFGMAFLFAVLRLFTHRVDLGAEGITAANLLFTPYAWMRGITTAFVPLGLCIDHRTPATGGFQPEMLYFIPLVAIFIVIGLVWWKRDKISTLPLIWYFATLLPTGITPLADVYMENRFYFATAGLSVGIGLTIAKLANPKLKTIIYFSSAIVFASFVAVTSHRINLMNDRLALWTDATRKYPLNTRALDNVALARFDEKDLRGAIRPLLKAVNVDPNDAIAWNALGLVYKEKGWYDQAIAAYDKAISASHWLRKVRTNRAHVLLQLGRVDEAEKAYLDALSIDPGDADAHYGLGFLYSITRMPEKAIIEMEKTLEINPNDSEARALLESLKRGY